MMSKGKKLYEGKAIIIYEGPEKGTAIQHFKDDATAFNNLKKSTVEGKGVLNNRISEHILNNINQIGIPTHFLKRLNMREQLIRLVEIYPIEFIVLKRNGSQSPCRYHCIDIFPSLFGLGESARYQ